MDPMVAGAYMLSAIMFSSVISCRCYQSSKKENHSLALFEDRFLCVFKATGHYIMTVMITSTMLSSQ
jgi:hypothetical protein